MAQLADALRTDALGAARAVIDIANAHMARALRAISIKRGVDTREHLLMSFGGAGGLHVCELAEELGMRRAMVPVQGGVLSALGMLAAPPGRQLSRTLMCLLDDDALDERIGRETARLARQAEKALAGEGIALAQCEQLVTVDLRYQGQSYTLNLPWEGRVDAERAFHRRHSDRYGHELDQPVELVTLRLAVRAPGRGFALPGWPAKGPAAPLRRYDLPGLPQVPLYRRERLPAGFGVEGPAIIAEQVATTWLAPGWRATVDAAGNLLLELVQ
jgi:N-methylhydantoinase A